MAKLLYASSTKDTDMLYAVKVEIPDAFFYLDAGTKKFVFLDHREFGVFKEHNKNPNIEVVLSNPLFAEAAKISGDGSVTNKLALHLLRTYRLEKSEVQISRHIPLDMADFLRAQGVHLVPTHPFFPERLVKTSAEIGAIRESLHRTHSAFQRIDDILHESTIVGDEIIFQGEPLTSEHLKMEVERILLEHNLLNMEGLIISCGPQAAIPHHRGHGLIRPHQTIICDIFPRHRESGYFADMTRTYVKGEPSAEIKSMYAAVLEAQTKCIEWIKPGITGRQAHQVCVDTFQRLGFDVGDKGFVHGTGHGLGLDVHEEPFLNATSQTELQPGHVVTVEPGLYYPERGGVRIEDVVAVTPTGCENLTNYPKEYIIP